MGNLASSLSSSSLLRSLCGRDTLRIALAVLVVELVDASPKVEEFKAKEMVHHLYSCRIMTVVSLLLGTVPWGRHCPKPRGLCEVVLHKSVHGTLLPHCDRILGSPGPHGHGWSHISPLGCIYISCCSSAVHLGKVVSIWSGVGHMSLVMHVVVLVLSHQCPPGVDSFPNCQHV